MFNNIKEETIIKYNWNIWCDDNGNLWSGETAFKVLDAKDYSDEEKAVLISEKKGEYLAGINDLWNEKQEILGKIDTARAIDQWDYEYNIRKTYLPLIIPDWLISSEDIALLAANICSSLFVDNIKKYSRQKRNFYLDFNAFVPDSEKETRQSYLQSHPYITESMECFVSEKWGAMDYPGGEILAWEEFVDHSKITCARRDDWEYTIEYVSMDFLNCKVILSEYDFDIVTYVNSNETHSFVQLCNCEITQGIDKKCRFHFLIKDEYGKYNDLILECDDVSIAYNNELFLG